MDSPLLNFVAAIVIGLVIGLVGGFALKRTRPKAMWMAPVLALVGSLLASVIALLVGDDRQYGWKEPILQVVLALGGVALSYYLSANKGADTTTAATT